MPATSSRTVAECPNAVACRELTVSGESVPASQRLVVGVDLLDFLLGPLVVFRISFQFDVFVFSTELIVQHRKNRKVVLTDVAEPRHGDHGEVGRAEHVVQGPAQEGVTCVESAVHAATDSGIEQTAHFLKQTGRR